MNDEWVRQAERFADRGRKAQEAANEVLAGQVVEIEPIASEIEGHRYGIHYTVDAVQGLIDGFRELDPDQSLTPAEVVAVMEAFLAGWRKQMVSDE